MTTRPLLEPLDEHNLAHLREVRPPGHRNPVPHARYNLVVLGAGPAGLVCAAGAAGLGARVALVERGLMGGDCLNVGCVPSKALLRSARALADARDAALFGARPAPPPEPDFAAAMARLRRLRARLAPADSVARFRALGVHVFLGEGRFVAPDAVEVAGQRLRFERAVIATGGRARLPDAPGLAELRPRTNEDVFWLTERPRRLVVVGAGPIGCELAQAFARLGSEVTLAGPQLLPREDADAARLVAAALARDGVRLETGARLVRAERRGEARALAFAREGEEPFWVEGDEVLVAAGRRPNVEGLDLGRAGVESGRDGVVVDGRLRTANPRVFAAGDVCSRFRFTHAADAMARLVIANALFHGRGRASRLVVPWVTYTDPELAHVGIAEREARERGAEVETLTAALAEVDRAVLDGEEEGLARVHVARRSGRVLGATLVARHAGEMLGEVVLLMSRRLPLTALSSSIHPYPTQAAVWQRLADERRRRALRPWMRPLLERWFAWRR